MSEALREEIEKLAENLRLAKRKASYPFFIDTSLEQRRLETEISEKQTQLEKLEKEELQIQETASLEAQLEDLQKQLERFTYGDFATKSKEIVARYNEFKRNYLEISETLHWKVERLNEYLEKAKFEQREFSDAFKRFESLKDFLSESMSLTPQEFAKKYDVVYNQYWSNTGRKWLLKKLKTRKEREQYFYDQRKIELLKALESLKIQVSEHGENYERYLKVISDFERDIGIIQRELKEFESAKDHD